MNNHKITLNIIVREIEEDVSELYIMQTLKEWHRDFKYDLIDMYKNGEYRILPDRG